MFELSLPVVKVPLDGGGTCRNGGGRLLNSPRISELSHPAISRRPTSASISTDSGESFE